MVKITYWGLKVTELGALQFIPSSTFTGTISNISIKEIINVSIPYYTIYDSKGTVALEYRAGEKELCN